MRREQFGRICKLEFINFATKKKFTIDNSLRISFEFLKAFDESDESSTGVIRIHGLTSVTANKLGEYLDNKFQSEVTCTVGYANDPENIQVLFLATVMSNKYRKDGGTSVTEIGVSANFSALYLSGVKSVGAPDITFLELIHRLNTEFNIEFKLNPVPSNYTIEGITPAEITNTILNLNLLNWSTTGTLQQHLEKIRTKLGMSYRYEPSTTGGVGTVFLTVNSVEFPSYIEMTTEMRKIKGQGRWNIETREDVSFQPPSAKDVQKYYISDQVSMAVVLSYDTGLLELPYLDNRNIKIPRGQALGKNEVIIESKAQKALIDEKTGKQRVDKNTGELKFSKPSKNVTVRRRFLSAKAFINPFVKPDSLVVIDTGVPTVDGQYRVRNVRFSGDTHEGDWIMEMEMEDTADFRDLTAVPDADENDSQDVEVLGGDS